MNMAGKTPQETKGLVNRICEWKLSYTEQVEREATFMPDDSGTAGFRLAGCDKCLGFNVYCKKYSPTYKGTK